jgi:hypothetical protein
MGEHGLVVRVLTTSNIRQIRRRELEEVCQHCQTSGRLFWVEIQEEYSPFNLAYVSTLLASVPGIRTTSRPIVLYYGESSLPSKRLSTLFDLEEPEEESVAVLEDVIAKIARAGEAGAEEEGPALPPPMLPHCGVVPKLAKRMRCFAVWSYLSYNGSTPADNK